MSTSLAQQILLYAEILQAIVATAAIIAAAWWFFARRENIRKANIIHDVVFAPAGKLVYAGVRLTVKNTGRRRIVTRVIKPASDPQQAEATNVVILEEISPFLGQTEVSSQESSPEFNLQFLGLRSIPGTLIIEPDEEQTIMLDFVIPRSTKAIKVYSHIDNAYNKSNGWNTATIHHVELPQPVKRTITRSRS